MVIEIPLVATRMTTADQGHRQNFPTHIDSFCCRHQHGRSATTCHQCHLAGPETSLPATARLHPGHSPPFGSVNTGYYSTHTSPKKTRYFCYPSFAPYSSTFTFWFKCIVMLYVILLIVLYTGFNISSLIQSRFILHRMFMMCL